MSKIFVEKECKTHGFTSFFTDHSNREVCCLCYKQQQKDCTKRKKLKLIELLGGKCELCGYNTCEHALEFHHIDKKNKEIGIGLAITHCSFAKCIEEVNKTILLCGVCHREVEYNIRKIPDEIIQNRLNNKIEFTGHIAKASKIIYKKQCIVCNRDFSTDNNKQDYCCAKCKGGRKIQPIVKEQIIKDLENGMAYKEMTIKYKVSTGTLIKWMKSYGIERSKHYKKPQK